MLKHNPKVFSSDFCSIVENDIHSKSLLVTVFFPELLFQKSLTEYCFSVGKLMLRKQHTLKFFFIASFTWLYISVTPRRIQLLLKCVAVLGGQRHWANRQQQCELWNVCSLNTVALPPCPASRFSLRDFYFRCYQQGRSSGVCEEG